MTANAGFTNHAPQPTFTTRHGVAGRALMKKIITCLFVVVWACGVVSAATPARDVLAHSAGNLSWFARISRVDSENPMSSVQPFDQTECYVRQSGPGQSWQELPPVVGRATALASRSSQLVLLMSDGQWQTLWSDGSSTGQPLPAGGKILALCDDGDSLWAIGSVAGGRAAADEAIVKELAATRPTTSPIISITAAEVPSSVEPATTQSVPEPSLVVFRQVQGRWKTFAEVPEDVLFLSEGNVSLTVVGGSPIVSFRVGKGEIKTLRWDAGRRWSVIAQMDPVVDPIDDFKLFSDGSKPMIWWAQPNSAGELIVDASGEGRPVKLAWKETGKPHAFDGLPAVTFSGGFIRVLRLEGKNVFEQRYENDGQPLGTAAQLVVPADANTASLMEVISWILLIAVAFSVGASIYRQWVQSQTPATEIEPPMPAPMGVRLMAGLIDLIPVIAAGVCVYFSNIDLQDPAWTPSLALVELCAGAIAVYLLQTTVTEAITSRSAGKWIFGLKVVTTQGKRPTTGQILIRNLLRLVDPLVMIVISPLRQRSADIIADTMVVRVGVEQPVPPGASDDLGAGEGTGKDGGKESGKKDLD
jgi:uncharacterized RDD family membrane protein YckC